MLYCFDMESIYKIYSGLSETLQDWISIQYYIYY